MPADPGTPASAATRPHLVVIDPALRTAELDCLNNIVRMSPLPVTYHLPGIHGLGSLDSEAPATIRGLIILGSGASVHDRLAWQGPLEAWVGAMIERHRIPALGLCYGHQMLAAMLGGDVGFLHADRRKLTGWREIRLQATPCWPAASGRVVVSHRETVTRVPEVMQVVGTSGDCPTDALAHRTLPVWSFQPHPEATAGFLVNQSMPPAADSTHFTFGHGLVAGFLRFCAG